MDDATLLSGTHGVVQPVRLGGWNSAWTAAVTTLIVVPLAYGLTRSCIPAKGFVRAEMPLPALAPIYLFGNQGMLKLLLGGGSIHRPVGMIVARVFNCFSHAAIILAVALGTADARLYEAAEV